MEKRKKRRFLSIFIPVVLITALVFAMLPMFIKKDETHIPTYEVLTSAEDTGASAATSSEKGGSLLLKPGASYTMTGGTISGTKARYGGAVFISDGATFTLDGGTITDCLAQYGGAIYVAAGGTCIIKSGSITGNGAENAPAIYQESNSTLTVQSSSVIKDNTLKKFDSTLEKLDEASLLNGEVKYFSSGTDTRNIVVPSTYNGVKITSVANRGFNACSDLESIQLPNTITSIGSNAFNYCQNLTSVDLGNNVETIGQNAFLNCGNLSKISFPSTLKTIESGAFNGCGALSVDANLKSVTSVGANAFRSSGIKSVQFDNGLTTIGNSAFQECHSLTGEVWIPDTVTSVGSNAFKSCDITSLHLGDNVNTIGTGAFAGCSNLGTISVGQNAKYDSRDNCNAIIETSTNTLVVGCYNTTIPSSVKTIGKNAFMSIDREFNVDIPEGVETVANLAYVGCEGIREIHIPASVISISSQSFGSCMYLEKITVAAGNTKYNSTGSCNAIMETSSNILMLGCKNTVVPSTTVKIGDYAFQKQIGVTSLNLPNGLTAIGNYAFQDCPLFLSDLPGELLTIGNYAFTSCAFEDFVLQIPQKVQSIGNNAFQACGLGGLELPNSLISLGNYAFAINNIVNLVVPEKVTKIGNNCFQGCSKLVSISLPDGLNSIGGYAFSGCSKLASIVIPANVSTLNQSTFEYCVALKSVSLPVTMRIINKQVFKDCISLKELILPTGTKTINADAFKYSSITSLYIPSTVTEIKGKIELGNATIYCERSETDIPVNWISGWNGSSTVVWDIPYSFIVKVEYTYREPSGENHQTTGNIDTNVWTVEFDGSNKTTLGSHTAELGTLVTITMKGTPEATSNLVNSFDLYLDDVLIHSFSNRGEQYTLIIKADTTLLLVNYYDPDL